MSGCSLCSELLSNCDICNGTSAGDAVCQACASGYVLDENDDCIAQQYCPDGTEGTVTYLSGGDFNFTDCTADDACPDTGEVAPECADCADGYVGAVSWVRTSDTAGNWDTSQCELVACPSEDETSPSCTVCPWGFTGTPYWDDSSNTWAGCASNEFGLSQLSASVQRSAARSTTPLLQSRGVVASFSADGSVVQAVESAPYVLERDSSGYFYKDNGAFNTAENHWNCEPGYGGADCSLRLCPHSLSFFADGSDSFSVGGSEGLFWTTDVGQKSSATFHGRHVYRECSGRGVCDYTIGECQCFDGFTGRGCRRRECPNACSGHGMCVDDNINLYHNTHATGSEESLPTGSYPTSAASADSNLWASELQQACVCDGGWSGHDCSLRLCPVGDDPETECNDELAYDVQEITCTGVDKDVDHFFSVTYTSPLGHRYTTMPVIVSSFQTVDNVTSTSSSLQQALEALPNFAVPSVEVDTSLSDLAGSDISVVMAVTFNDPANTGEQPLLQVTASERCEAGSSPYFVNTDTSTTCTVARVSQSTSLREQAECSNRGLCNTRTGECACYDGYGGRACQTVSATI